jgi:multidrug efflux pump subunit AcrA (membrane-fusion protein)
MGFAVPKNVKADALPCTVTYLNQAKEMQATATTELNAAKAVLAEKQAKLNSLVSAGINSGNDYLNAVSEVQAAQGQVEIKKSRLNDANSFVKDCESKYTVEDNADKSYNALQSVNTVQAAKLAYDNAQAIATAALTALNNTKAAIAGYQAQLATSPAVQAQIDALNVQLNAQTADYNKKQATADQKKAEYTASLNSNYASYDKKPIEYIYIRDDMRNITVTDLNKDGKIDGEDFFIGVGYYQGGDHNDPFYRQDHYIEEARNAEKNKPVVYKQGLCHRW